MNNDQAEFELLNGPDTSSLRRKARRPISLLLFFAVCCLLCAAGIGALIKASELEKRFKVQSEKEDTRRNEEYTTKLKAIKAFEAESDLVRAKTDAQLGLLKTFLVDRTLAEVRAANLMLNRLLTSQGSFSSRLTQIKTNEVAKTVAHDPDRSLELKNVFSGAEKLSGEDYIARQIQEITYKEQRILLGAIRPGREEQVAAQKLSDWAEAQLKIVADLQKLLDSATTPKPVVTAPKPVASAPTNSTQSPKFIRAGSTGTKFHIIYR